MLLSLCVCGSLVLEMKEFSSVCTVLLVCSCMSSVVLSVSSSLGFVCQYCY